MPAPASGPVEDGMLLLGPPRLASGGAPVPVGSPRETVVLSVLALSAASPAPVAQQLVGHGLLDEQHLWVHPVLRGGGTSTVFAPGVTGRYGTVATRTFDSGVVVLELSEPVAS